MSESEMYKSPAAFCRAKKWGPGKTLRYPTADGSDEYWSAGCITAVGEDRVLYRQLGWFAAGRKTGAAGKYTVLRADFESELRLIDLQNAVPMDALPVDGSSAPDEAAAPPPGKYKSPADFCRAKNWVAGDRLAVRFGDTGGWYDDVRRITAVGLTTVLHVREGIRTDAGVCTAVAGAVGSRCLLADLLAARRLEDAPAKPAEPAIPTADDGTARSYWEALGPALREKAGELGYALAVLGPLNQTLDLLAFPWRADAADAPVLAEALRGVCCGAYVWSGRGEAYTLAGSPGDSPHGRLTWGITLNRAADSPVVQLSVAPKWPSNDVDPAKVATYLANRTRSGWDVGHAKFMELLRGGRFDVRPAPPPPCGCGGKGYYNAGTSDAPKLRCTDCGASPSAR